MSARGSSIRDQPRDGKERDATDAKRLFYQRVKEGRSAMDKLLIKVRDRNNHLASEWRKVITSASSRPTLVDIKSGDSYISGDRHRDPVSIQHMSWNKAGQHLLQPAELTNNDPLDKRQVKRRRGGVATTSRSSHQKEEREKPALPDWLSPIVQRAKQLILESDDLICLAWPIVNVVQTRRERSDRTRISHSRIMKLKDSSILPFAVGAKDKKSNNRSIAKMIFTMVRRQFPSDDDDKEKPREHDLNDSETDVPRSLANAARVLPRDKSLGIVLYNPKFARAVAFVMSYKRNENAAKQGRHGTQLPKFSITCKKHGEHFKGSISESLAHRWPPIKQ